MTEWQPIETIPKDDTPKLIASRNGSICIAPGIAPGVVGSVDEIDMQWYPTHWAPLPDPPKT